MVPLRPQTPQGESVAKPRTLLLLILNLECKFDIHGLYSNVSNPFFEKKVCGQKRPRYYAMMTWDKRNVGGWCRQIYAYSFFH